jgi:hypothetical protein
MILLPGGIEGCFGTGIQSTRVEVLLSRPVCECDTKSRVPSASRPTTGCVLAVNELSVGNGDGGAPFGVQEARTRPEANASSTTCPNV